MAKPRHYSPVISRFLVSVLYHERKARRIPMTKLVDQLLRQALVNSEGWKQATTLSALENTPPPLPESREAA